MKKALIIKSFLIIACLSTLNTIVAQCPMCRMTLESNYQNGGTTANGMNTGILYLLVMPYLIVGTIAYVWYKNKKKAKSPTELEAAFQALNN